MSVKSLKEFERRYFPRAYAKKNQNPVDVLVREVVEKIKEVMKDERELSG